MNLTRILLLVGVICSLFLPFSSAQCLECCTCDAGAPGSPGADGATGEKGQRGRRGLQGETGVAGPTGPTGEDGLTGAAGATGAKGDTGDAGPQGETGATGSPGAKGDSGDPQQKSAFHVYSLEDTSSNQLPLEPIRFKSTFVNTGTNGQDYDLSTGIFTCSIAGVYKFNFAFTKPSGTPGLIVEIHKGQTGSAASNIMIRAFSNSDTHNTISNSLITNLSVDETVWVEPHSSHNNFYLSYPSMNSFSGELLYPS